MITTTKTVELITLQADADKVLCDGYSKTSVGGSVIAGSMNDLSGWVEMTEAEADALIEANTPKEEAEEVTE
jgi:hypothetical protein